MPTEMEYASSAAITITLTSLADGAWRQSAALDNTSNKYLDAMVDGSVQVGTSPTADEYLFIYAYGSADGTNYTGGASGSDAAYTADGEEGLFKVAEVIQVDGTTDQDYRFGPFSIAALFGGFMPIKWGLLFRNETGVALNATGTNNEVNFRGLKVATA